MSQEGLKDVPGLQELRQRFAEKAVAHYVIYRARRPDDLAVTEGHARSLAALGTVIGQVGSVEKPSADSREAIRILKHSLRRTGKRHGIPIPAREESVRARKSVLVAEQNREGTASLWNSRRRNWKTWSAAGRRS